MPPHYPCRRCLSQAKDLASSANPGGCWRSRLTGKCFWEANWLVLEIQWLSHTFRLTGWVLKLHLVATLWGSFTKHKSLKQVIYSIPFCSLLRAHGFCWTHLQPTRDQKTKLSATHSTCLRPNRVSKWMGWHQTPAIENDVRACVGSQSNSDRVVYRKGCKSGFEMNVPLNHHLKRVWLPLLRWCFFKPRNTDIRFDGRKPRTGAKEKSS